MRSVEQILAELALARAQVDRERARGQREGESTARLAAAIPSTIAALADVGGRAYEGAISGRAGELESTPMKPEGAYRVQQGDAAPSLSNTYQATPEEAASRTVQSVKPANWFDEALGITSQARSRAVKALSEREAKRREQEYGKAQGELARVTGLYGAEQTRKATQAQHEADRAAKAEAEDAARKAKAEAEDAARKARAEEDERNKTFRSDEARLAREEAAKQNGLNRALQRQIAEMNRDTKASAAAAKAMTPKEDVELETARMILAKKKSERAKEINDYKNQLNVQATVKDLLAKGVETGRTASGVQSVRGFFGANDPLYIDLESQLEELKNLYGRAVTNSTLQEAEYKRSLPNLSVDKPAKVILDAIAFLDRRTQEGAQAQYPEVFGPEGTFKPEATQFPSAAEEQSSGPLQSWVTSEVKAGRRPTPDEIRAKAKQEGWKQ